MAAAKSVVVCLSGGVDSTVAAHLLQQQGYDVVAITFWFWSFSDAPDYAGNTKCCSLDAAAQAARELGVPHEEIDASDAFYELVLEDFVARYRRGETPNPCGRCNRLLRFGTALEYAQKHGLDYVATGHHVRLRCTSDRGYALYRGRDPAKDQTYFLYGLQQKDLARLLFPVGELTKQDVFSIAHHRHLSCAELPESQDLCFAVAGETAFLFEQADLEPGPILDLSGHKVGQHQGLPRYTIGQRRGVGIPAEHPLYVVDIDPERNALIVGEEDALLRGGLCAKDANYLSGAPPPDDTSVETKIRYRSSPVGAVFRSTTQGSFSLAFHTPQRAVTPGQLAVLYEGNRLLGGGTITREADCPRPSPSV